MKLAHITADEKVTLRVKCVGGRADADLAF